MEGWLHKASKLTFTKWLRLCEIQEPAKGFLCHHIDWGGPSLPSVLDNFRLQLGRELSDTFTGDAKLKSRKL